jgi:hypothetical protein
VIRRARVASFAACAVVSGCGTVSPLLVEPRATAGEVRQSVGAAALIPVGGAAGAIADARTAAATGAPPSDASLAVVAATRPGVTPLLRTTIPVGHASELALDVTGRSVAVGGRYFVHDARTETGGASTLSIGARIEGLLDPTLADALTTSGSGAARGAGVTVPVAWSWQSDAGLVLAYVGAQLGGGWVGIDAPGAVGGSGTLKRAFGAATLGLGVGFRRVHVLAELGIEHDWLALELGGRSTSVELTSLTPAFALSIRF